MTTNNRIYSKMAARGFNYQFCFRRKCMYFQSFNRALSFSLLHPEGTLYRIYPYKPKELVNPFKS